MTPMRGALSATTNIIGDINDQEQAGTTGDDEQTLQLLHRHDYPQAFSLRTNWYASPTYVARCQFRAQGRNRKAENREFSEQLQKICGKSGADSPDYGNNKIRSKELDCRARRWRAARLASRSPRRPASAALLPARPRARRLRSPRSVPRCEIRRRPHDAHDRAAASASITPVRRSSVRLQAATGSHIARRFNAFFTYAFSG